MEYSMLSMMNAIAVRENLELGPEKASDHFDGGRIVKCKDGTVFKLNGNVRDEVACALHGGVAEVTTDLDF